MFERLLLKGRKDFQPILIFGCNYTIVLKRTSLSFKQESFFVVVRGCRVSVPLFLFDASILTLTFHWAMRVNLCLISEDTALEGIIDQPVSSCMSNVLAPFSISDTSSLGWICNNNHASHVVLMLNTYKGTHPHIWLLLRKYPHTHTHTHTHT